MTEEIWFHASSQKFENLHSDGFLLSKAYKVLDEKSAEELCLMTQKSDPIFEENWLLVPKMTLGIW